MSHWSWRVLCAVPLAWSLLSAVDATSDAPDSPQHYSFTFDGEAFQPGFYSLDQRGDRPREGDFIDVAGIRLRLGTVRRCDFISTTLEDGRLLLKRLGRQCRRETRREERVGGHL